MRRGLRGVIVTEFVTPQEQEAMGSRQDRIEQARRRKARNDALIESGEQPHWLSGDDLVYVLNGRLAKLFDGRPPATTPIHEEPPLPEPPEPHEKPQERGQPPRARTAQPFEEVEL